MAEKERIKDIRTPMAAMQYIPPSAGCPSTNEELRRPSPQVPGRTQDDFMERYQRKLLFSTYLYCTVSANSLP